MRAEGADCLGGPLGWAVVNTHSHRERIALENLRLQDFHTYCPLIKRRHRHGRRVSDVLRPLFPGYLFVQVNSIAQVWRPIVSTIGVRTLVRCGDRLSLLEDAFVRGLKAREMDGVIARPATSYKVGQTVRLAGGAFDGFIATIIEMDDKDRLIVLMDLLSRPVKARVSVEQLSPA